MKLLCAAAALTCLTAISNAADADLGAAVDQYVQRCETAPFPAPTVSSLAMASLIAAEQGEASDPWHFTFTLYAWIAGMTGTVGAGGASADPDVGFDDVATELQGGLLGHFVARKGRWSFAIDGMYLHVNTARTNPILGASLDTRLFTGQVNAQYRLLEKPLGDAKDDLKVLTLDGYAGFRYYHVKLNLTAGSVVDLTASEEWFDPVLGADVRARISKVVTLLLIADIGGFGVGSDFTWQAFLGADFRVCKWFSAGIGWRWLGIDYRKGVGSGEFIFDVTASGPLVAFSFHF